MTRSKFVGLLASLALALVIALPVRAAAPAPQPYVVLVGISKYADRQILPRPHAEDDVKALYDVFTSKDYLGVDAGHVRLLLASPDEKRQSQDATHANILKALTWAVANARTEDPIFFAFFGQGAPVGERNCYFASDSTFKDRSKNAISAREIEVALAKLKSERFCAFIDVNFKGFDSGKQTPPEVNLQGLFRELVGKEDADGGYTSRVVFLANNGLKPSLDLEKHGVFAQALLDGLRGKADQHEIKGKGDKKNKVYQADGNITVESLARYVRKEVADLVKKNAKTEEQKKQRAVILEGQVSDYVLTHNPAVMPTVEKKLAQLAKLVKDGVITDKVAREGKELLSRMPRLQAKQKLREAFQDLVDGKVEVNDFNKQRSRILAQTRLSRTAAERYARAVIRATQMLKAGYVKEVNQGQLVGWAIEGLYRRLEEKVPLEFKDRLAEAKTLTQSGLSKLLRDIRENLGKREDLANGKDVTYTLNPMLAHLDKHTDYISPEILEETRVITQGVYFGIGAHIRLNTTRDMLEIVSPIMGSPAFRAPLYAGDIVTTITREVDSDGNPLAKPEVFTTKGMTTEEAVRLIKGKAGTKVKLTVERKGADKPLEFEITRAQVEVETVMGYKRKKDNRWSYYVDPANKIAYLRLTQFSRGTYRDLETAMKKVARQGINAMVLDLRFNPGGLLDSAVKVSDLFIDDGVIVSIRPRRGRETVYYGKHEDSYLDFPMVCLVNDGSASGSEIVSACLQDHGRAVIMGERSYGKGSVQTILEFKPTGGQLKMTNATFWRPNGKNLNKTSTPGREQDEWGVTPDQGYLYKMPIKEQDELFDFQRDQEIIKQPGTKPKGKEFKDRHLEMALKYLRGQIKAAAKLKEAKKAG